MGSPDQASGTISQWDAVTVYDGMPVSELIAKLLATKPGGKVRFAEIVPDGGFRIGICVREGRITMMPGTTK